MLRKIAVLTTALVVLTGCSTGSEPDSSSTSPTIATTSDATTPSTADGSTSTESTQPETSSSAPTSTAPPAPAPAEVLDSMSLEEKVGQLLMVDCPSDQVADATVNALDEYYVGSVILDGTNDLSVAQVKAITRKLQSHSADNAKLFISTDQEGGEVQRLQGSGFDTIPSAVQQGQLDPTLLQQDATQWGKQLKSAGVNVDLAPVLDIVPANFGSNPPIGDLDREFGHTPNGVSRQGLAVVKGLAAAGVDATVKHFPGLGRVRGNTDTTAGVTDNKTTVNDPYLQPFADAVQAGVPFVMVSSATYAKIDAHNPAAFSKPVITTLLRGKLGFNGVVISDDLGSAQAVAAFTPGERAVNFIAAGGDMVLTVDSSLVPAMTAALIAKAQSDDAFKAQLNQSVLRVLTAKAKLKLLR
ncbi:MAG TPA: glycoside hydrolase family 3 N-terminal domain-containing protein [Jatrophihabitans sp.]